jgi:RHS repeat-associated protein
MTFTLYGLTAYSVQYWNSSSWVTIPNGTVTGNNKVWRKFTFSPITTSKIRVLTSSSPDAYSRLTEVEAWGPTEPVASAGIRWLVADHLGTPRMIIDQTGDLANMTRHDYLPFGEELFAPTGGRTTAAGYAGDGVRQQFTSKERDVAIGLDYFKARYYSSVEGRFTSIDPLDASGFPVNPQSWNRYSYVLNDPIRLTDPDGEIWVYEYLNKAQTRIRIKWINASTPGENQFALNFGGQQTVDVVATDGRVVRISQNCDCRQLLRGPQRDGSGGYVNTGLVNELGRRTAPMPMAVAAFTLLSLNGGGLFVGSPILLRNAIAFSLFAVGELGKEEEGETPVMGNVTQYEETTRGKSVRNVQTDTTKEEFIKNLEAEGFKKTTSGNVTILEKGDTRFAVYNTSRSGGVPSAAKSTSGQGQSLKIRLKP